jgi:hypothetical protein
MLYKCIAPEFHKIHGFQSGPQKRSWVEEWRNAHAFNMDQKIGIVGLKDQGTPKCKSICVKKKGVAEIGGSPPTSRAWRRSSLE